jgi:hypothetical protein
VPGLPFAAEDHAAQPDLHEFLEAVEAGLERGVEDCAVDGGADARQSPWRSARRGRRGRCRTTCRTDPRPAVLPGAHSGGSRAPSRCSWGIRPGCRCSRCRGPGRRARSPPRRASRGISRQIQRPVPGACRSRDGARFRPKVRWRRWPLRHSLSVVVGRTAPVD